MSQFFFLESLIFSSETLSYQIFWLSTLDKVLLQMDNTIKVYCYVFEHKRKI